MMGPFRRKSNQLSTTVRLGEKYGVHVNLSLHPAPGPGSHC